MCDIVGNGILRHFVSSKVGLWVGDALNLETVKPKVKGLSELGQNANLIFHLASNIHNLIRWVGTYLILQTELTMG